MAEREEAEQSGYEAEQSGHEATQAGQQAERAGRGAEHADERGRGGTAKPEPDRDPDPDPEPSLLPRKSGAGRDPFGFEGRDLLPDITGDEQERGWGDERGSGESSDAADLRRFLDEKPPHHL